MVDKREGNKEGRRKEGRMEGVHSRNGEDRDPVSLEQDPEFDLCFIRC